MKQGFKFSHWGMPTTGDQAKTYLEGAKVWISDFAESPFAIEWLRFEEGSPMHKLIQEKPHVAFEVESLADAIKGEKVIVEPFPVGDNLTCAFIEGDGFAVELMEFKK